MLLGSQVLEWGDIFVLDNCTMHKFGDNIDTQEFCFCEYGILMIFLSPYHPDFSPMELILILLYRG